MAEETLYFGEEVITAVADGDAPGIKRVTTEKGGFDVPEWEYIACVSQKSQDRSAMRNARSIVVVQKMLELLQSLDVRVEEIGSYIQKLLGSMEANEEVARLKAFGFSPQDMVEMQDMANEIRMSRLDKFMKQ